MSAMAPTAPRKRIHAGGGAELGQQPTFPASKPSHHAKCVTKNYHFATSSLAKASCQGASPVMTAS